MFKKTALLAGIGLALSVTAQADYRWELGGGYSAGSTDTKLKTPLGSRDNSNDADIFNAYGTYYLENVDTSKGPLGEAAFLDHASDITLFGSDGEVDFSNFDNKDGQTYGAKARYVAEGPGWKLSGWLVDIGYERREPGDQEINNYNLGIGGYVTPNTTVVVNYSAQSLSGGNNLNEGGDTDGYSLDLEHMFLMAKGGFKARASAGRTIISDRDDVDTYKLGGTWYITNNIGIGADYLNTSDNGYEINGYSVSSEWFVTESLAVNLAYEESQPDDIRIGNNAKLETDISAVTLGALYRF
jgi:hypothetical protein